MTYVFSFLGEFGYELFNWQGVIRKWAESNKKPEDKIIICSRKGLKPIYDFADHYINISELDSYNNVIADCYTCYVFTNKNANKAPRNEWTITRTGPHLTELKKDITNLVNKNISYENVKWIWSSDYLLMDGFHFGLKAPGGPTGGIYNHSSNQLNLNNNKYIKIKTLDRKSKTDYDLDKPYILCQTAWRSTLQRSKVKIDYSKIFDILKNLGIDIIALDFNTGKNNDSFSKFNDDRFKTISCNNLEEQLYLIEKSKACIFLTEGDLRSHLYIPPFIGKDVIIISPQDILNLDSAPIEFWNKNVFKFGGQMIPIIYEHLIQSQDNANLFLDWVKDYIDNLDDI
jgi:hypothetical protein